jgi:fibronectin type 3 domain-containing protein
VQVALTVSEALSEAPFFSLEPQNASPIVLSLRKVDDTHYAGSFTIDITSPYGSTAWKFSGKDLVGNRGNGSGSGPAIDNRGPIATVAAPVTLLKTTAGPVAVALSLDEPSTAAPTLTLKASDGSSAQVAGLASTDNGLHWSGTLDPSALAEGTGQFLLAGAKDRFGNVGTTIKTGSSIVLYKNTPPAAAVPTGLAAKPGKGGSIALTWTKVTDAQGYNVYRQGSADSAPVLVTSIAVGTTVTYTDTPASDGSYVYSVSSLGLLNVESAQCAQVSAISDRTPPAVPTGLAPLTMTGNGVQATWDAVTAPAEVPASYKLYRAAASDLTDKKLVATTTSNSATDPAPASSQRFYAVTALDALGNESAPTPAQEITFPVAPVGNLILTLVDDGRPSLSWSGDSSVQGFYIYRNGAKINQTPTTSTSYSDGYYSGGAITYGVSAVDANGTESPVKEVTLPVLTVALKDGTTMHRGVLETVALMASIPTTTVSTSLNVDAVSVKIGTLPESTLNGPFTVTSDKPLEIDKVAATEANAPPQEAVVVTAIMYPAPGTTVKLTKSYVASVLGSGTALEIFNDPLVRGTQASVRLKVNNLGTARTEFLTSENGGTTPHVRVYLKDQDGNVLAQGNLGQRTGSVVNSGSYATARLEAGESFLSDPIVFAIPPSAPSAVFLAASIDNTYYHYNQDDQVIAPGLTQSVNSTIADVSYLAVARTDKTVYKQGESVQITGQATSTSDGTPMPLVPVKVSVSVKGFDRFFTVTTDGAGAFSYTFVPAAGEAGSYNVWASHPDLTDRSVQSQFSIIGLQVSPSLADVQLLKGQFQDIPVILTNLGGSPLTALTLTATASSGITASVVNPGADTLAAGERRTLTFRIAAAANASDSGTASLSIVAGEGLTGKVDADVTMVSPLPLISTSPSYIDTGLMRGNQRIATFTVSNTGYGTLMNPRIEGPSLPWLSLAVDKNIGDCLDGECAARGIKAGQSKTIGVVINPGESLPQGVYNDRLVIYADNHIPYTYNVQVTVTSNAVGSVQFSVLDELMKQVGGASITVQNQSVTDLLYNLTTAADGTVSITDIPEGRYSFNITAPGHSPYGGSFVITPGVWTTVPVGLEVNLVQVEWSVTPTTIQDQYQVTVTQTFETNVPAPVLVTEPASVTLPDMQPGQVYNGEFTVKNYGLIAVDNPQVSFPTSFGDYDLEILLTVMPKRLEAMQKMTVPYRITRRQATASAAGLANPDPAVASVCSEVGGYGGGMCVSSMTLFSSGTAVICPNSPQQRKIEVKTPFTIAFPYPCSGLTGTGTPWIYVPPPPSFYTGSGSGTCKNCQIAGGDIPGGSPTPLKTANPCDCKPDGTPCPLDDTSEGCNMCKGGTCTHLPREQCQCAGKDDGSSCDDQKVCTSSNGTDIGPDACQGGFCVGKEIQDQTDNSKSLADIPSTEIPKATSYLNKLISKIPGASIDSAPSVSGGSSIKTLKRCCEKYAEIRTGQQLSATASVSTSLKINLIENRLMFVEGVPVGLLSVTLNLSGSASATLNTDDDPCNDGCTTHESISADIGGSADGTLQSLDSIIRGQKCFLTAEVTGSISGNGSYNFNCNGNNSGKMCLEPAQIDAKVLGFGFTIFELKLTIGTESCI